MTNSKACLRRASTMTRPIALLALLFAVAGCERISRIGQPPDLSPVGAAGNGAQIAPARVAVATPEPYYSNAAAAAAAGPVTQSYASRPPVGAPRPQHASLWRSGPASLFGDRRAQGRGDLLTVVIEIDEEASISNATSRNRSASEDLSVNALLGIPELIQDLTSGLPGSPNGIDLGNAAQLSSGSGSSGDGTVKRQEQVTLRLAATVMGVLPNGHFLIAGSQEIRVNYELRELTVQGVIRPEDISRTNEITYDKIADARVSYGGRGVISDVQQPRYGQELADIILPF